MNEKINDKQLLSYPQPPWELNGSCAIIIYLRKTTEAQNDIPFPLKPKSIIGKYTLAGYYLGIYNASKLGGNFSEFGIIAGLCKYKQKYGFYIKKLWVDSAKAYRGGKEIWGANKGLAKMKSELKKQKQLNLSAFTSEMEMKAKIKTYFPLPTLLTTFSFFSLHQGKILRFSINYQGKLFLASSKLNLSYKHQILEIMGYKILTVCYPEVNIKLLSPQII